MVVVVVVMNMIGSLVLHDDIDGVVCDVEACV